MQSVFKLPEESASETEQLYDCSSEESDTSDSDTISCDPLLSTHTDTKTASSRTRMTKATSSRKQFGTQFVQSPNRNIFMLFC